MAKPKPTLIWRSEEDGCVRLLSGKYDGDRIQEIPDSYLKWCITQHAENDWFDEDLIVEMEEEIAYREKHGTIIRG